MAGLPYSFDPAIQHDGCTYLRRSVHEKLGLFTPEETREAFRESLGMIQGLSIAERALAVLVRHSSGHPYMMQLLGYHLLEYLNGLTGNEKSYAVSVEDINTVLPLAMEAYERRALRPLVDALPSSAQSYLRAMAETMGEDHVVLTGDVARHMNKTHQQLASARQTLIGEGIIVAYGHGRVRFAVPYLRTYLMKPNPETEMLALLDEWDV